MIELDHLPPEIASSTRAVLWNLERRKGKDTKVPYVPHRPADRAAVDDAATWGPFADAVAAVEDGKATGAGIVLGDGLIGLDYDDCRDPETGRIDADALAMVQALDSYTEISPSGHGLHVLVRGTLPGRRKGRRKGRIEMYADGRYFTVTGRHVEGTPRTIEERTAELAHLHARIFGANGTPRLPVAATPPLDDAALVERARSFKNGAKFAALWSGDATAYPSASEADLALCNVLAFLTGKDAARMDRLFRSSGLMRPKWDERRGDQTYGELTIARAIADCRETLASETPAPPAGARAALRSPGAVTVPACQPAPTDQAPAAYTFTAPVPADHFLARWIAYASSRTDAAHEYHEATGLVLLASATPNVRARLAPYPNGLPTNLYALLIGDSTTSRKSTSKDLSRDVQDRALPGSLSADHFSPEGFVEQLTSRPHDSTTLYVDEFGELLDKLHHSKHMAGLRGLLMTVYAGDRYTYRRHSKRGRDGAKVDDEDRIEGPHLSILGATTPAVFDILTEPDVTCGLLVRFAIVMPSAKPARRPFFEAGDPAERDRSALVTWLARVHEWAVTTPPVHFETGVLERLDDFAARLEQASRDRTDTAKAMCQRLTPMAVKVAMLIAAGRPGAVAHPTLDVTLDDADAAIEITERWQSYALAFASRIGESDFERKLQRCAKLVQHRGRVERRVVAQNCHTDKRTLDMVQETLVDRGLIQVEESRTKAGGRALQEWVWTA